MTAVELTAGPVEYTDTGGSGPVLVLLHGLMMDSALWDEVILDLSADYRCVAPTLPLGAHRRAMRADADLSLPGVSRLVTEFLDRFDLRDVTLVGNDGREPESAPPGSRRARSSTGRPSSSGRLRTGSCRPSTGAGWPGCYPTGGLPRSGTATR